MTYNPGIPLGSQKPSQSRAQIQTNFFEANSVFGEDHVEFDDATAANRGNHKKVTLVDNTTDPALLYPKSQIYTKNYGTTPNENNMGFIDITHEDNSNQIVPIHPVGFVKFTNGRTINQQFNVASIGGSGNLYVVNFTKAFPNANYIAVASSQSVAGPSIVIQIRNPSVSSVELVTTDTNDSASTAFTALHCIFYTVF